MALHSWKYDRDMAGAVLAAHNFSPPWSFPSVEKVRCITGHGILTKSSKHHFPSDIAENPRCL